MQGYNRILWATLQCCIVAALRNLHMNMNLSRQYVDVRIGICKHAGKDQ